MALYVVDGHALAYRAYYAFAGRPLTNSSGEETSAVYGFVNTLLTLLQRYNPSHLVVAFDGRQKTFRHDMFDAYKANRDAMPEGLVAQFPVIFAVVEAMRIPQVVSEGFEADDIIATMASRWKEQATVHIVSGDKDLFQLIDDQVSVIRPGKGAVLENELNAERLVEQFGLRPDQIVDYLALMGDSSDNIPGVRGIGEKTARKLLKQYGSLDAIYENIAKVSPPGVKKKLKAGHEDAILSRNLVVLRHDVPLDLDLDDLELGDFRTEEFRSFLEQLEFHRMQRQVFEHAAKPAAPAPSPPPPAATAPGAPGTRTAAAATEAPAPPAPRSDLPVTYECVDSEPVLRALCDRLTGLDEFALDVETTGLDPMRDILAGVSVATRPGRAYYIPIASEIDRGAPSLLPAQRSPGLPLETVRKHLGPVLAAERPAKVGQNIKYDELVLVQAGMPVAGITFDTMLASYCLDPARRSHGLDALALDLCGHVMTPFTSLFDKRTREKDIRTVPLNRVTDYACEDADFTLRLKEQFAPLLSESTVGALFADVEMPLRDVLARMELMGVRVDLDTLEEMSTRFGERIATLEKGVYEAVDETFNINSTQKLREILFDRLGLAPARRTKTGFSTDVDVLTGLSDEHPVVPLLLEYRQLVKLKTTYVDALPRLVHPDTGRVHTSYNQAVTTTGRLSSSDPNLQNIPIRTAEGREIRKAFVPRRDGWVLLDADYSQIELRILAHLSGDEELIRAFRDDADVHRRTAAKILGVAPDDVSDDMRSRAKTVNFGIVYGMGARGLSNSLGIEVAEARQFIDDYFRSYPGVKRFIDETIQRAHEEAITTTMLGRTRRLPDIDSSNNRARAFSERIAVNTPVQGTAADIIKLAMLEVDRRIRDNGMKSRMILQVHDELLFDVPESELDAMRKLVRESMETAVVLNVPLKVDMDSGRNWYEAH